MRFLEDLPDGVCLRDAPLAPLTWFNLGGRADFLVEPRNEDQLATVIRRCRDSGTPIRVLGLGANVLVSDDGVRGVVVRLTGPVFTRILFDDDDAFPSADSLDSTPEGGEAVRHVTAGGGADLAKLTRACLRRGLGGLEQIAGIPGTVGGGIAMNCGGRFGDISTSVVHVRLIDPKGELRTAARDELDFGYRRSSLGDDWVSEAVFQLRETDRGELERRSRVIWLFKQQSQPAMAAHSAGCIFKNPAGQSAGRLIDCAGLKGFRIGSAFVSDRHANFVLADAGGRAADVLSVIKAVKHRVQQDSGISLEPEVKIW